MFPCSRTLLSLRREHRVQCAVMAMPAAAIPNAVAADEAVRRDCVEPAPIATETSRRGVEVGTRHSRRERSCVNSTVQRGLRDSLCHMTVSV